MTLSSSSGRAKRVLIVDDDRVLREVLESLLSASYDVVSAGDGEEALQILARDRPDVVLVDLVMPLLDGEGLLRRMKDLHPDVPTLVMSSEADLLRRVTGLGPADSLRKPFSIDVLETKIERLLEKRA